MNLNIVNLELTKPWKFKPQTLGSCSKTALNLLKITINQTQLHTTKPTAETGKNWVIFKASLFKSEYQSIQTLVLSSKIELRTFQTLNSEHLICCKPYFKGFKKSMFF